MGWAKFDDRYSEHPKVCAAGPLAELLDRRAIEYCARQETDGVVVTAQAKRLCADLVMDLGADWEKLVATLVEVGRWHETAGGWLVHDFLDYHPSRADREAEREAARERMAKNRAKRKGSSPDVRANNGRSSHYPVPDPQPVPLNDKPLTLVAETATTDALEGFEEFWKEYPRHHVTGQIAGGGAKQPAKKRWRKLKHDEREACLVAVRHYADAMTATGDYVKHPEGWLNERRWEQWQEPVEIRPAAARGRPAHASGDAAREANRNNPDFW